VPIDSKADLYKKLPSVDELIRRADIASLVTQEGQPAVAEATRAVVSNLRTEIQGGRLDAVAIDLALSEIDAAVRRELLRSLSYSLRAVVNATGVILHTNLGRAPLSEMILDHIRNTAVTYSNLEFDLGMGERGKRDVHVDRLFRKLLDDLTSAPSRAPEAAIATIVVNNNAAAVLLALNTLAEGGEVIVSRGELVEIGGSFRIPDVMAKSNAILREVGTTNRTRVQDYERAINEKTRLLLRVHRSNFQITGFTEQPELGDLARLARARKIPLMEDLGSGALFDLRSLGINGEPSVLDSLAVGADVVTYSGDKLLGGPQAGILSGRADLISRMRSNSLFRALRVDKLTYAALEATLLAYVKGDHDAIPAIRMMRCSKGEISRRAADIVNTVGQTKLLLEMINGESLIGGGAAPSAVLPTRLIAVSHELMSADELAAALRRGDPPVIARVEDGRVLLDLRTVFPEQDQIIVRVLQSIGSN
jgi:L-seryl-tRNA(Ser) seleniumtransferase